MSEQMEKKNPDNIQDKKLMEKEIKEYIIKEKYIYMAKIQIIIKKYLKKKIIQDLIQNCINNQKINLIYLMNKIKI